MATSEQRARSDIDALLAAAAWAVQDAAAANIHAARGVAIREFPLPGYPNPIVAGRMAAVAGEKARHIRNRGFDSQYYRDLIVALVRAHQPVSREDIDKPPLDKLPEVLTLKETPGRPKFP